MLFNSLQFLIFFPIVLLVYFIIPKKIRYIWLLVASYYFYMCWNAKYALLILFSTLVTYLSGLFIDKISHSETEERVKKTRMKLCVAASFVLNLGVLCYFKYTNFLMETLNKAFNLIHIELNLPVFDILLPVGISFYIFQALSYTMDIYRGEVQAEKNFLRYALFVSFFPQLVAGPIERSKNLLSQLAKPVKPEYDKMVNGFMLMLWGFFMKIVVADRIALFVDSAYNDTASFGGWYLIVASVLFAFQIYCDFGGYSCIAKGTAQMLGIELMENFNAPYTSLSVREFWGRWHISLSTWFRDYLYIPLGGNRKGKIRKHINKMIVFLVSGLWHGASWSFVIWGGLHGLYQVIGEILEPVRNKLVKVLRLNRESIGHKLAKALCTFILVDFAWIFFRSQSMTRSKEVLSAMINVRNPWIFFDDSLYNCGLDRKNFTLMLACILLLIVVDMFNRAGIRLREVILKQDWWFKWVVIALSITAILLFGVWGSQFSEASFIYFQF
ncbi:MAG: MBOAT family protein [Lachnospiraceae bacterium]|nr:MBOAT family protein [Lachnospiraceae bacterium]